jgi:hypothetical protein
MCRLLNRSTRVDTFDDGQMVNGDSGGLGTTALARIIAATADYTENGSSEYWISRALPLRMPAPEEEKVA